MGNISHNFEIWKNATQINESDEAVKDKYCVSVIGKRRYIIPLVRDNEEYVRINTISEEAQADIQRCLDFETKKYAYLDFNF